jgi:soluble lytic murein transglycosylase-like protein
MADGTVPAAPGLGLRQHEERRSHQRRRRRRTPRDRRRLTDRRKRQLGGLLIAAAALTAPHARQKPIQALAGIVKPRAAGTATVQVVIDSFRPLKPEDEFKELIQEAAQTYDVDPNLIRAVMEAESAFDPQAVSRVGAQGLMQLMPALQSEMGVTDPFDPRQNIMAGARYLRQLLDAHRGNLPLTLASYNAGPGTVKRYKGIPPFEETRDYVEKITDLLADAPPEEQQ